MQAIAFIMQGDRIVGAEVDYADSANNRVDGKVNMLTHLQIDLSHPDYAADADRAIRAVERLLANVLDDWADSEPTPVAGPARSESRADDDEGLGMGHGDQS